MNSKLKNLKVLWVASLLFIAFSSAQAQESINASGGKASGSGGSSSFSVGQVVFQTHEGTAVTMSEGVQQPYEIWVVTSIDEALAITLSLSAYPNPTKDFLTLEIRDFDPIGLTYQLFDMSGKVLIDDLITDTHTRIDMNQMVPAVYFLRVVKSSKEVKTFKVIKN